jgi:4-hydroxybenzoate polyprenyltransferase
MVTDIGLFVKERFPLPVTLPLTLILFAGPASLSPPGLWEAIFGWASTFLALLCLRIADDLASLQIDTVAHPERGLQSGRIKAASLKAFVAVSLGAMVLWQSTSQAFLLVVATITFYILFFKGFKERLPLLMRPFFSNVIFAVIPCYAGLVSGNLRISQLFLAGFVWLAAVAHEWAHNVHGSGEVGLGLADYVEAIGGRPSAAVALALFASAAFFALLAWIRMAKPWVFGMLLVITTVHVGFLGVKLIKKPEYKNAKPFYVAGFTFFLLPLAGLIIDCLLGQIAIPK